MKYYFERHTLKRLLEAVISEHYQSRGFSVPKLARLMQMNERTLHRQCRKHLAKTPKDIIRRFKISEAKKRLKKGEKSETVAALTGYRCKSAFLTAFKKEVGVAPTFYLLGEQD